MKKWSVDFTLLRRPAACQLSVGLEKAVFYTFLGRDRADAVVLLVPQQRRVFIRAHLIFWTQAVIGTRMGMVWSGTPTQVSFFNSRNLSLNRFVFIFSVWINLAGG